MRIYIALFVISSILYANFVLAQDSLHEQIQNHFVLRQKLENTIVLIKNNQQLIPVEHLETKKIAVLSIGFEKSNHFVSTCLLYANVDHFLIDINST